MRSPMTLALVFLAACAPEAPRTSAKFWTAADFASPPAGDLDADLGGFTPRQLVAKEGAALSWNSPPFTASAAVQGEGDGLTIFPAYAEGQPAAYVITDVWQAHPQPWVQPVWLFVSRDVPAAPPSAVIPGSRNVFPVDVTASFYSPFWQAWWVLDPSLLELPFEERSTRYSSARDVLDAELPQTPGALILCPLVPSTLLLAQPRGAATPQHPFTGQALVRRSRATAWVDGHEVTYLDLGAERAPFEGDALREAFFYRFVGPLTGAPTSLPVVLPPQAHRKSLMRPVDVALPPTVAIFVPAERPELAARLRAEGFTVPMADPTIAADVAAAHQLRIASDASCFTDATRFPGGCTWLDSEAALRGALGPQRFTPADTQVALAALLSEGVAR